MAVGPGSRLGPYEVTALIGEGGMGKVWRAHHTALNRDDALKVLPDAFASDPDRLARFRREAQVLASLNHPNIAHVYGLEQSDGVQALVMELVEGPTLADRIAHRAIPPNEALAIAKQIAEALEVAHEQSIIHRDLKPANVKLRPDGTVKVLDFGLAKVSSGEGAAPDLSQWSTVTAAGHEALLLGTPAYMSPEQARGDQLDKRTDIWAFGCVLYEMLTGRRAFAADDVSGTLARVLMREPDWDALPATTPQSIRVLLRHCLQKDAKKRLRDAADVHIEIEDALNAPATPAPPPMATLARWRHALPSVLTGLVGAVIAVGIAIWNRPAPAPRPVSRAVIALAQGERLAALDQPAVALSPDGTQLVYVASDSGGTQRLYLRAMDSLQARPLAGTEGASGPFFSTDGQWIAFFAGNALKKVSTTGGAALTLMTNPTGTTPRGASWGPDDTIVLNRSTGTGLQRVPSSGGAFSELTVLKEGEVYHRWPAFLPGGKTILFTIATTPNPADWQIAAQRLDTGERKVLVQGGTYGRYSPTGHLVYYHDGSIMARPFDPERLEVTGTPAPVLEGVMSSTLATGAGQYSFSSLGALVYLTGSSQAPTEMVLAWVDRKGAAQPLPAPPRPYATPFLSPDGRRAVLTIGNDIWIYDLSRGTLSRLTTEGRNVIPRWTPDGKRVAYSSDRNGVQSIAWRLADGSGPEELLLTSPGLPRPQSFTPDGRALLYTQSGPKTSTDLWVLPLEGNPEARKPHVFLQTPFSETNASLSPDGRWVAHLSTESGRNEIYVRPFPGPGGKVQISTEGGQGASWSPKGNEIFYRVDATSGKMMVVDIQTHPTFSAGKPRLLFEASRGPMLLLGALGLDYSVTPDGQRFLTIRPKEPQQTAATTQINVVLNWDQELKRLVPTK